MRIHRKLFLLPVLLLSACSTATPTVVTTAAPTAEASLSPTEASTSVPTETPSRIPLDASDIQDKSITFWHVWDGARGDLLEALVEQFNAENEYGIEVTASRKANIFEEVGNALQQSTAPNAVVGFNYHVLNWMSKTQLPDLTPYIDDLNWGLETNDFFPAFSAQTQHSGGQFGLPFYRTAEVLFYNETWAKALGFSTPPSTPEDLRVQACAANTALRNTSGGDYTPQGGLALNFEPTALVAWMSAFEGSFNGRIEGEAFAFDRQENVDAFRFLRSLLDDSCAWIPDDVYPHTEFANRQALFLPSTLAGVQFQAAAMMEADNADEWTVLPYPRTEDRVQALFYGPDLVLLPGEAEETLAAWVFIKWLSSPDNNHTWLAASGYYPARQSGLEWFDYAAAWLPDGVPLEAHLAWPYVQWVAADTARVLFAPLITLEDVAAVAQEFDILAEEVSQFIR